MIIKVSSYVDAYGARAAHARNVHELDGRDGREALTRFINQTIRETLHFQPEDRLLDIGCGDGVLLRMATEDGVSQAVGVQATEAEADRIRSLGLSATQGLADALPFADSKFNVVVCNAVLVLVPREKIDASLREIARTAELNARVWIGEIPVSPEMSDVPRHRSVMSMLWFLVRNRGLRTFLGMCRRLLVRGTQRQPVILNTAALTQFWASPRDFIAMASDAGLALERYFPYRVIDSAGKIVVSPNRYDYIFRKS